MRDQILPALRFDLQFLPARAGEQDAVAVRDPLQPDGGLVLLRPEALAVLPLFDGRHRLADLQEWLVRASDGQIVSLEDTARIVEQLDELLLLRSPRFDAFVAALEAGWQATQVRPPAHAGEAYPAEPEELAAFVEASLAQAAEARPPGGRVRAIVAPHLDPRVGAPGYAHAYAPLRGRAPDRVVVLGTGHALEAPYSVCAKPYRTPLGTSPTDPAAIETLRSAGGPEAARDFAHRDEHSIEFQVVFLQHLFGSDVPVVAVLCGSLHAELQTAAQPDDIPAVARFAAALGRLDDGETLFVAGVDLSHVGPKFGHPRPAADFELKFRGHDQALLRAVAAGSAGQLWAEARRIDDRFHVCGLPALACLLTALGGLRGEIRHYEVWFEAPTESAVSYAALLLE